MKKRMLLVLVGAMLLLGVFCSVAAAADTTTVAYAVTGGNIYFDPSTGEITSCDNGVTEAVIPDKINGVKVTGIGSWSFDNLWKLTKVVIPQGVTTIDHGAFQSCKNLSVVVIPESVGSFPGDVFMGCTSLKSVGPVGGAYNIQYAWKEIPENAFCNLENVEQVTIAEDVVKIGASAFRECSLSSVVIPKSVIQIGAEAFDCENLTTAGPVGGEYDIQFSWDTVIPKRAFSGYGNLIKIQIPEGITAIEEHAFYGCSGLTEMSLPEGVRSIGDYAFFRCNKLSKVDFGQGLEIIGENAFEYCANLSSIAIPGSVISIGYSAFDGCKNLKSAGPVGGNYNIELGEITEITQQFMQLLRYCETIVLPDGVVTIGENTFSDCGGLTDMLLPDSVKTIGARAFYNCDGLTDIELPDGVTAIGRYAFSNCNSLSSIVLPNGVTTIDESVFSGCDKLTDIVIPAGVTTIGKNAFAECSILEKIVIPSSVICVETSAFENCKNLKSAGPMGGNYNIVLEQREEITQQIKPLFQYCETVVLPNGVVTVGGSAFSNCDNLSSVVLPAGVTTIGNYAFNGCDNLSSIMLPSGVTSIGKNAFYYCKNMSSIEFPEGVTEIGDNAFYGCGKLKRVVIPKSMTSIGKSAFSGCGSLTDVYYTGSEIMWDAIGIGSGNSSLTGANICYEISGTRIDFSQANYEAAVGAEVFIWVDLMAGERSVQELAQTISWHSSNEDVFAIDENNSSVIVYGNSKAEAFISAKLKQAGTAIVTASLSDGMRASCTVTAVEGESSVAMPGAEEAYVLRQGDVGTAFVDITAYTQGTGVSWTWQTDNKAVVAFSESGQETLQDSYPAMEEISVAPVKAQVKFYARSVGTATVSCTLSNGAVTGRTVKVLPREDTSEPVIISNEYNVPKTIDPPDQRTEKYLNEYQAQWYEAYEEYTAAVKAVLQENAESELTITPEKQAELMLQADEAGERSYLSFDHGFPEEWKIYAYRALCEILLDTAGSAIDFDSVSLGGTVTVGSDIVKELAANLSDCSGSYTYDNVTVEMKGANFWTALFGRMSCTGTLKDSRGRSRTETFGVTVCSTQEVLHEMLANYLNALRDLGVKSVKNVYTELQKDLLGDTLGSFTTKYLENRFKDSGFYKSFDALAEELSKLGLGRADRVLMTCTNYYNKVTSMCDNILADKSYDFSKDLKSIENLNFESTGITDAAVKKAVKKLNEKAQKLISALEEYALTGTITEWNDDAWDVITGIKCPVSVTVYNSRGEEIGYIGPDGCEYTEDILIEERGDAKLIYSRSGEEITFQVTGNDYGAVNCYVETWQDGAPVGRTNFYDIPVEEGTQITACLTQEELSMQTGGKQIACDEYISAQTSARVRVETKTEGLDGAVVLGDGIYVRGDPVVLRALPKAGYAFGGWYNEDGLLISASGIFSFTAREDVSFTARYVPDVPSMEKYLVNIHEAYEDLIDVVIVQKDSTFTVQVTELEQTEEPLRFTAVLATYDDLGKMTQVQSLVGQPADNGVAYSAEVHDIGTKLFLLDQNHIPVMQACVSR